MGIIRFIKLQERQTPINQNPNTKTDLKIRSVFYLRRLGRYYFFYHSLNVGKLNVKG